MALKKTLISCVIFVIILNFEVVSSGIPSSRSKQKCGSISKRELLSLKNVLAKSLDENESNEGDCDEIMRKTINFASRNRNTLKRTVEEHQQELNQTEAKLSAERTAYSKANIQTIPQPQRQPYMAIFFSELKTIKAMKDQIETKLSGKRAIKEKIDYYNVLTKSVQSSTQINDNCDMSNDKGEKIVSILQEIFTVIKGEENTENCFGIIRIMLNIESLIETEKTIFDDKLDLTRETYNSSMEMLKFTVQDIAEQKNNPNGVPRDSIKYQTRLNSLTEEQQNLQHELSKKSFDFVVEMIRAGKNFYEAKLALADTNTTMMEKDAEYTKVLTQAYECDQTRLNNVVKFAEYYDKQSVEKVFLEMQNCNQASDPIIIKIKKLLPNLNTEQFVKEAYTYLAGEILSEEGRKSAINFMNQFGQNPVDVSKLVEMAFAKNKDNLFSLLTFILELDQPKLKLENNLYREFLDSGHIDTVEHVRFGYWLQQTIHSINYKPQTINGELQKKNLNEIKENLPTGIKNLFFEPVFVISSPNYTHLIRGFGHESVQFNLITLDNGEYFRITEKRDGQALFVQQLDVHNHNLMYETKDVVFIGKAVCLKSYYWQIIPTKNAKFFYIKNKSNGRYISKITEEICFKRNSNKKCKSKPEYYNRAEANETGDVEWMITLHIIRDGILPDRTHARGANQVYGPQAILCESNN